MTADDIVKVITAIGGLGGVIAAVGTFINGRSIRDVKLHTNGMKDELVAEVRKAALAKGRQDEKENPGGKSA